jgi:predicted DCC family thiol-disulfide oxidoreductase YuxK
MTGGGRHAQQTTASAAVADAATAAQTAVDVGSAPKAQRAATTTVLLYDGECPLCLREVAALRTRAAAFETAPLAFVDIAAPDYDPAENGGVTFEDAMGRIHAVMPSGEVVVGVDVFRRVYEALGLGWVYGWTKLPVLGTAASAVYDIWAANRLALTGRPTLAEIVALREKADKVERDNEDGGSCNEDGCSVDRRHM